MNPQKSFRLPCDGKTADREPKIKYSPRLPAKFGVERSRMWERVDVGIDPYRNIKTSVFNKNVVLAPLFGARTDKSK